MGRRILVVDDDPDVRTLSALSLERVGGHEVRTADSGPACLDLLATWRPDVVVLDVMMPGMDGPQTLGRIRSDPDLASVPVVFLTASVLDGDMDRLASAAVTGVLGKPFDPLRLPVDLGELMSW